jgi:copper chaperone
MLLADDRRCFTYFTFDHEMIEKTTLEIEGMNCGHCVNAVKNLIEELDGIELVEVELSKKEARISFHESKTSSQAIIENINNSNTYKAIEK